MQDATGDTRRPVLSGRKSEVLAIVPASEPLPEAPPAGLPGAVIAPSFNCARAATPTEKAICASPAIATPGNVMVQMFKKARCARHGAARRTLLAQQKNWIRQRDTCRSDIVCLAQCYGERIGQLQ